ncbi:unnamed protein product, partial [Callosobruchus maculatus]
MKLLMLLVSIIIGAVANEPRCKEVGVGVFPSEYCDQYYRCSKKLFWY